MMFPLAHGRKLEFTLIVALLYNTVSRPRYYNTCSAITIPLTHSISEWRLRAVYKRMPKYVWKKYSLELR